MPKPQNGRIGLTVLPTLNVPPSTAHHADVLDFGAAGDGKKDDAAAFEKAIASLPTRTDAQNVFGGVVFVPAGEYRLSRPLRVPERVILMGEHQTTTLLHGGRFSSPLVTATGDHMRVENLTLISRGPALSWFGGRGATVSYLSVHAGKHGIVCETDSLGGFSNVDVHASKSAVVCNGCRTVSFFSLSTDAPVGLTVRRSGPVCVHGLHHLGAGPGVDAGEGSRAAIIGGLVEAKSGEPGVICDATSLVHVSSFGSPHRPLAIDDAGGETARVRRPHVGLYTGQATIIPEGVE